MTSQIFLPCYFGNQIMVTSSELNTHMYHSNWSRLPKFHCQLIIIYMERLKRALDITVGQLFMLNMRTFVSVKFIHSHFRSLFMYVYWVSITSSNCRSWISPIVCWPCWKMFEFHLELCHIIFNCCTDVKLKWTQTMKCNLLQINRIVFMFKQVLSFYQIETVVTINCERGSTLICGVNSECSTYATRFLIVHIIWYRKLLTNTTDKWSGNEQFPLSWKFPVALQKINASCIEDTLSMRGGEKAWYSVRAIYSLSWFSEWSGMNQNFGGR